ncbi:MAG: helix-turn-helix domain-containing protein [Pseudomonadota bacterium]
MKTEFMLLAIYQKPFLTFQEVCDAIGISHQTGYNMRSNNSFPVPILEKPIRASIQDVAEYIDQQREIAKEKVKK